MRDYIDGERSSIHSVKEGGNFVIVEAVMPVLSIREAAELSILLGCTLDGAIRGADWVRGSGRQAGYRKLGPLLSGGAKTSIVDIRAQKGPFSFLSYMSKGVCVDEVNPSTTHTEDSAILVDALERICMQSRTRRG